MTDLFRATGEDAAAAVGTHRPARLARAGPPPDDGCAEVRQAVVGPALVHHCAALLSPAERARAARTRPPARDRFTVARGLLRSVLGGRLGLHPARVPLAARCPACGGRDHGPVRLMADGTDWRLSVSHAGLLVAVAVDYAGHPVGVDVETAARTADTRLLEPRLFGPAQRPRLAWLPPGERRTALLTAWTGAESYAKASGTPLGAALARIGATVDDDGRVAVARPDALGGWWVRAVPAGAPGHVASVATRDGTRLRTD
ncbi:4'-phosphopantetheinyl transferase superfamily protein [Streptomyces sp. NPDC095613]|uniref:4'-phosphopantetheinyl transferase family protein n=1 Tax=Streptomyces sp. NPDC095613 TaxID=3155540 RepID=UPI003331C7E0